MAAKDITASEADGDINIEFSMPVAGTPTATRLRLGRIAHTQTADKLGIPRAYYRRMFDDAPELLVTNVNRWLHDDGEKRLVLVRALDDYARALLSNSYRILDNYSLFFHVYAVAKEMGATVQRMDLSDERFYMRLLMPDFGAKIDGRVADLKAKGLYFAPGYLRDNGTFQGPPRDAGGGEWVFPAIVTSNSEVGYGSLSVGSAVMAVECINYLISAKTLDKIHLGERKGEGFVFSDETQRLKDETIWSEARDMVRATFDPDTFREMVLALNEARATELVEPVEAVDVVVRHYGMSDDDRQAILNEMISPSVT